MPYASRYDNAAFEEREREAYIQLICEGGRPVYPLHRFEDVCEGIEHYRALLEPWHDPEYSRSRPCEVFWRQLDRFQAFRKWQNTNRGLEEVAPFQRKMRNCKKNPLYPKTRLGCRERELYLHRNLYWKEDIYKKHCGLEFSQHNLAVKRRLEKHGFSQPVQLEEKVHLQGKLSTWIEYLAFECWYLDIYTATSAKLKVHHDNAWNKLAASGFLFPFETPASVRAEAFEAERKKRLETAQEWYESAKLVPADQLTLQMAKDHIEQGKMRDLAIDSFVEGTSDYIEASTRAARHFQIVQWVKEQIPLVVGEITDWEGDGVPGFNVMKRVRDSDVNDYGEGSPKRQKWDTTRAMVPDSRSDPTQNAGSVCGGHPVQSTGVGISNDNLNDSCMEDAL
ncbi:hypothetical protein G7Z17_g2030 [Cylindrodendrum hubeiense]|uniref:Uncharacterized protein n=1 Tax=Cylindrodendrum hubeiense TaxID=595255 RepID=A0A9P5HHB8_9HYPO|nr:hypothetical protein G7Z17_g2030 [Cylindrodendrum hubeiense]